MTENTEQKTRDLVLEMIRAEPGITRERLIARTRRASGVVDPARIRLWEAGRIEPEDDQGWHDALAHKAKTVGWVVVDDPERRKVVAERAAGRKRRNAKPSAERQAREVVEALKDPIVNRLVNEMTKDGSGSPRAQTQAAKVMRAEHMARKRQADWAARDKAANAEFRRVLVHLWDARGVVGAVDSHLIQERARVANGEPRRISDADWAQALADVRQIIQSFGQMWQNVRDLGGKDEPCPACGAIQIDEDRHVGAFVLDVEAEE